MLEIKNPHNVYFYSGYSTAFGVVDQHNNLLNGLFCCRDKIQDYYCELLSDHRDRGKYDGFNYVPVDEEKEFLKELRLLMSFQDPDKILNVLDFINKVEQTFNNFPLKSSKMKLTKITPCECQGNKGTFYLFTASKKWLRNPVLLSMYTLMLRSTQNHNINNTWQETAEGLRSGKIPMENHSDPEYWKVGHDSFSRIVETAGEVFYKERKKSWTATGYQITHFKTGIWAVANDLRVQFKTEEELKKYGVRFSGVRGATSSKGVFVNV